MVSCKVDLFTLIISAAFLIEYVPFKTADTASCIRLLLYGSFFLLYGFGMFYKIFILIELLSNITEKEELRDLILNCLRQQQDLWFTAHSSPFTAYMTWMRYKKGFCMVSQIKYTRILIAIVVPLHY